MTPVSTTIASLVIILAVFLKNVFGIELTQSSLETTVSTILALLAGLRIYTERVKRGDVNIFGIRKDTK